jgi:hypothetical protein
MPQAIVAAAVAAASTIGGQVAAGLAIKWGAVAFSAAVSGGLTLVSMAMTPRPKGLTEPGRTLNLREPTASRRVIYGRTRVGGVTLFAESMPHNGAESAQLQMFIGYAGHEVDGFEAHYFDDTELVLNDGGEVTNQKYMSLGRYIASNLRAYSGHPEQHVGLSAPSWSASDRLQGIAGIRCIFLYSTSAFPKGVPTINSIVRGKRVYDPRTGTTAWSDNAALCIRDYLTDPVYGLGATAAELDDISFMVGANICDETVLKSDGTTEKRYTLNGIVDTDQQPVDILRSMLTACGGTLVYTGGVWRLYVAAAQTATVTLDEHDIIGRIRVQPRRSRRDLFNRVRGVYVSPVNQYQPSDFPPVVNALYRAQDGGEEIWADIELPFTDSPSMAQRLAKVSLEKNRQQITVECRCKLTAFRLQAGLWVKLSNRRRGWDRKLFEVQRWQLVQDTDEAGNPMLAVDLTLQEIAPGIFDWNNGEETTVDLAPDTNLPDPWTVAPPAGLTLSSGPADLLMTGDGTAVSRIRVEIESAIDAGISRYEVQYKRSGDSVWIDAAPLTGGSVGYIAPVQEGIGYDVRVRAVSILGVPSAWVVSSDIQAGADATAPGAPVGLTATPGFRQITLQWTNPPASPDLAYVEIWEAASNDRGAAVRVGDARGTVFLRSGLGVDVTRWYWARAVDRSGNVGAWNADAAAGVPATTLFVDADDFSEGVTQLFEEAGAYGIQPVATLPAAGGFDGEIVYLRTDRRLYRWDAAAAAWTTEIYAGLAPGSVGAAAFAAGIQPVAIVSSLPAASGYTGPPVVLNAADGKLYRLTGGAWSAKVPAADITGTLAVGQFAQSVRPVEVLSALPPSGNFEGRIVYLTSDDKLYRYTGSAWTSAVPASDLSGQISGTQISDGAVSTPKLAAGAVTANEMAANAVTAGKIAAGVVSATELAAGAVTASKVAIGDTSSLFLDFDMEDASLYSSPDGAAITFPTTTSGSFGRRYVQIGSSASVHTCVTGWMPIETGADYNILAAVNVSNTTSGTTATLEIEFGTLATNGTVTPTRRELVGQRTNSTSGARFNVNVVTAAAERRFRFVMTKSEVAGATARFGGFVVRRRAGGSLIVDGAVTADKMAANAVTAGKIAAGAVTADQLAANAVTTAKLAAGAVTTNKIAANSITAGLLAASGVITNTAQIADGIITNAKIQALSADKLRAGYIDTLNLDLRYGNFRVWDSNNNRIRVQIGHIPGYDYGIVVYARNGDVIMDAGGVSGVYIHDLTVGTVKVQNGAITNVAGAAGDAVALNFPYGGVAEVFYTAQGIGRVVGSAGGGDSAQVEMLSASVTLYLDGIQVARQTVSIMTTGSTPSAPIVLRWIGPVGIGTHTATVGYQIGAGSFSGKAISIKETRK